MYWCWLALNFLREHVGSAAPSCASFLSAFWMSVGSKGPSSWPRRGGIWAQQRWLQLVKVRLSWWGCFNWWLQDSSFKTSTVATNDASCTRTTSSPVLANHQSVRFKKKQRCGWPLKIYELLYLSYTPWSLKKGASGSSTESFHQPPHRVALSSHNDLSGAENRVTHPGRVMAVCHDCNHV